MEDREKDVERTSRPESADRTPAQPQGESVAPAQRAERPLDESWTVAALAHASVLVTFVLAFAGGVGAFVGLLIPLVIYLSYRERSSFIAFHALQALVYQGVGVLVYLVVAVTLGLVVVAAWAISGLLSAVIIGLLLMPLAMLLTAVMLLILLGGPVVWLAYGLYAAYSVYQGAKFRYWFLGEWVESEVKA